MAAPLSLTILSLLLFFSLSSSSPSSQSQTHNTIHQVCKASRDPPTCEAWLSNSAHVPSNATVLQVVQSAVAFASYNIAKARSKVQDILSFSAGNQNHINATKNCLNSLHYSEYRINLVSHALPRGDLKDARAWISAALGYLYDCWSALNHVNNTSPVAETMSLLNSTLIGGSSNALGIIVNYDFYGEKTAAWGAVKTERDGFWEHVSSSYRSVVGGSVPAGLKADVSVCKSGKCHYKTVQAAVNAAPVRTGSGKRFVIRIKAGVYEEMVRVPLEKKNIVFIGDGMGKTVITGSKNVGQNGVSTYNSATVGVLGDGFMAKDLTIKNTARPNAHQAVAFVSDSDKSIIENCEFIGNQDTLYAHSLRQYYKSCRIQGNIDFIFGNSAAFFANCIILVAPRQLNPENGEKNTVTAHGRIDPAQSTGFVFHNCVINGTEAYMSFYYSNPKVHKTYLGRPWKQYSRTMFIRCTLEALIMANGWLPWDGDFALKTLYYGEFGNRGKGANTSNRVWWSNRIPGQHVDSYSVRNFIQGDQWITV